MTCSSLMLVGDGIGDVHMDEAYCRVGLMTPYRCISIATCVSFCLPHVVPVSAFIICRGFCACVAMFWM